MNFFDCLNKVTDERTPLSNLLKVSKHCAINHDALRYVFSRKKALFYENEFWLIVRRVVL